MALERPLLGGLLSASIRGSQKRSSTLPSQPP
jgi:hypothetical protein